MLLATPAREQKRGFNTSLFFLSERLKPKSVLLLERVLGVGFPLAFRIDFSSLASLGVLGNNQSVKCKKGKHLLFVALFF